MCKLTSSDVEEVLASSLVHFNVSLADVVLVAPDGQVAHFLLGKAHERLAIPPALGAETQCYATPGNVQGQMSTVVTDSGVFSYMLYYMAMRYVVHMTTTN